MTEKMKLYEVPRNSLIGLEGISYPIRFFHIDGMYSVCKELHDDRIFHLGTSTEVEYFGPLSGDEIEEE